MKDLHVRIPYLYTRRYTVPPQLHTRRKRESRVKKMTGKMKKKTCPPCESTAPDLARVKSCGKKIDRCRMHTSRQVRMMKIILVHHHRSFFLY